MGGPDTEQNVSERIEDGRCERPVGIAPRRQCRGRGSAFFLRVSSTLSAEACVSSALSAEGLQVGAPVHSTCACGASFARPSSPWMCLLPCIRQSRRCCRGTARRGHPNGSQCVGRTWGIWDVAAREEHHVPIEKGVVVRLLETNEKVGKLEAALDGQVRLRQQAFQGSADLHLRTNLETIKCTSIS